MSIFIRRCCFFQFILILLSLSSCQTFPPIVNQTNLSDVDFTEVAHFKRGESCTSYLFGFIPFGAARITSAARDGHIKKLKVMEYESHWYVVVTQFCVIAYGT